MLQDNKIDVQTRHATSMNRFDVKMFSPNNQLKRQFERYLVRGSLILYRHYDDP